MTNASRIAQQERPAGPTALMSGAAGLLAAGAVLAPLAFGATEVWAYCSLQLLVAVAVVLWGLSRDKTARRLWLPLAVLLVGAAQVIPLAGASLERAAPLSFEARQQIGALVDVPPDGTISVNAAHTLAALRRVLMVAMIVVVVADVASVERYRRWLIRCIAAVGVLVLLLGILVGDGPERKALGFHDRDGYWKFYKNPLLPGFHSEGMGYADEVTVGRIHYISNSPVAGAAFGALINANHFAVCIGLTLPIVLGLLLASTAGGPPSRRWLVISAACGYALVAAYAVAVSAHARAGVAGIVVSGAFVAVLAAARTRQQRRIVVIGLLLATAGGALLALRFGRPQSFGGRYETWTAALEMFRGSRWLGVGLGNFPTVYPALRSGAVAYFAHSAWLEVPAESGVVGSTVLLTAVAWIGWLALRGWDGDAWTAQRIMRFGLIGSLLFAAFHGVFDYSIQIPGNAYLCAVLIGLLIGDAGRDRVITQSSLRRSLSLAAILPAIGFAGFLVHGATHEMEADRLIIPLRRAIAMQRVPGKIRELDEKPELLQNVLPDAIRAFEIKPHEATFADYLGQAFLHLSRGRPGPELQSADDWFSRSLRLCPVNPWTEKTLSEIRAPENPVPDEPRERKRPRRPTNARPGRSAP